MSDGVQTIDELSPTPAAMPADDGAQAMSRAPVVWWAVLGAAAVAFETYLMVRWVTGPYFERVPSGPSVPPTWMKITLVTGQIVSPVIAAVLVYRLLIRPWRKQRIVASNGLLCLACLSIVWQDTLSNYAAPYLTYNSYLLNWGAWVHYIPGWQTPGNPGAMTVDPILFSAPNYLFATVLMAMAGSWFMSVVKRRRPGIGNVAPVAALTGTMLIVWPIIEGGGYMPLGFFEFPGGAASIFPEAYHKYPLPQVLCASAYMVAFSALWHFRNERGQMVAERGIERLRLGLRGRSVVRLLALIGIANAIFLGTYNLPLIAWTGASVGAWPRDLQSRSYLTDYLCGAGTSRQCPRPAGVPPRVVPFGKGDGGPYTGPLLGETKR